MPSVRCLERQLLCKPECREDLFAPSLSSGLEMFTHRFKQRIEQHLSVVIFDSQLQPTVTAENFKLPAHEFRGGGLQFPLEAKNPLWRMNAADIEGSIHDCHNAFAVLTFKMAPYSTYTCLQNRPFQDNLVQNSSLNLWYSMPAARMGERSAGPPGKVICSIEAKISKRSAC
ncbi:Uncharacterised protein [Shewanella algae]|uniref:Uncharacterized protein n=1 Tax=Shewanella algae TaxID=38313 RepID=A0A379YTS5_9GAMM|nr:Uncharacterised protein [Shewanella algae]